MQTLLNFLNPGNVILIGAILVAIGGYWAQRNNKKVQDKLNAKTEKISELNEFIISSVTGGDTYPYIRVLFARTNEGKRFPQFQLMSEGEYPLFDLTVKIIDSDKAREVMDSLQNNIADKDISKWTTEINIGNVRPREAIEIKSFMFPDGKSERTFGVELFARNGFFRQNIKIIKTGENEYKVESSVRKGDKILKEL